MKTIFNKLRVSALYLCAVLLSPIARYAERHLVLHALDLQYPAMNDFINKSVGLKDKAEIIWQPLYDWVIFPTAGLLNVPFFQVPQGQGFSAQPLAAAAPKTEADTLLTQGGMLPSPQASWIDGMEFKVDPGGSATANLFTHAVPSVWLATAAAASTINLNDQNIILRSGVATLTIMQKIYYQDGPVARFVPSYNMQYGGNQSVTGTNAQPGSLSTMTAHAEGKPIRFAPGHGIKATTNFGVNIRFPATVVTTAPGSGFNARIGCWLNGWQIRAAQ